MPLPLKLLIVFGTRPEAIKMAPLVAHLKTAAPHVETRVCVTGQHRQMLDSVLDVFDIDPDYDLDLMQQQQTLHSLTAAVITSMQPVLAEFRPDRILVHGDTTTTLGASLAAFYEKIAVGHVEAGLRTGNFQAPWPEEMNRVLTGRIADMHFAPTDAARRNLRREGVSESDIFVCGNTVIDALFMARARLANEPTLAASLSAALTIQPDRPLVLMTGHRRENFGTGFDAICRALRRILLSLPDVQVVWPVHLNPSVREPVQRLLGNTNEFNGRLKLIDPVDYLTFTHLMTRATLILTDSGGIQEEAAALGKPTLVLRTCTERPEVLEAGTAVLVGTDEDLIVKMTESLLRDQEMYARMSRPSTIFGDGAAAAKITSALLTRHQSPASPTDRDLLGISPRQAHQSATTITPPKNTQESLDK